MIRTCLLLGLTTSLVLAPALPAQDVQGNRTRGERGADPIQAEIFRRALEEISTRHRRSFSDSALWALALDGLIESLDDPYAEVFTPRESEAFDEQNTGNYSGIGVQITQLNGAVTVTKVFRGTPADDVGLLEGDVIVDVDGRNAREWTTDIVADSIRGPVGTEVRVTVDRDGFEEGIPFEITRAEVHVPAVEADIMAGGIGYITVDRVARGSAAEVDSVLRALPSADALILDLRRNPGGFLDESLLMADVFLSPGQELASLRSRRLGGAGELDEESWSDRVPQRVPGKPLVILVDRFTASAAEIVAGALQDHDRALIIGERTFGKGVVQTVLPLPHDHRLRLTTGEWYTPLGRSLNRPRDADGRPLAEDVDTFPEVETASGRRLLAAGGIFPDLEVRADSLKPRERELLQEAAESEVSLGVRIQELGFQRAQELSARGARVELDEKTLEGFLADLEAAGLSPDLLGDPVVREYLAWRLKVATADRMNDVGQGAELRMERDPVLAEAVRLLTLSATQPELFARAASLRDERAEAGPAATEGGSR